MLIFLKYLAHLGGCSFKELVGKILPFYLKDFETDS
jgi:hypothetical protein